MKRSRVLVFVVVIFFIGNFALRADWPEFRGPTSDGHAETTAAPPLQWSETNNLKWKTPIPYKGLSTPVVMDDQVWLTTATEEGHEFYVLCLDAKTGHTTYLNQLFQCENPETLLYKVNSYATPSPAIEAGRVYVHFGSYGTACIDTKTKEVLWKRQDLPCRHYRGPASSPILFENLLILTFDGVDLQYLVALDKNTGKTVWKTDRSVKWNDENATGKFVKDGDWRKAHSTPLIIHDKEGNVQLISSGAKAAYAYDPRTGKELWRVRYNTFSAAARPLYRDGLAFIDDGYAPTPGNKIEMLAIRVDGHGDVTDTHVAWRFDSNIPKSPSPILVDDLLYMVSDNGTVTCLEAETGKEVWHQNIGGDYAASPLYANGRIYFFNKQDKSVVIKPGHQFEALSTNFLSSGMMASPAASGKTLFLRTQNDLNCIEDSSQ